MTELTTTSHIDKRKHGITVKTTEYFDEARVLVKKQLDFFNEQKQLTLMSIEDFSNGTTTELKPKPAEIQPRNDEICFIKTIYNKKCCMLSQGTADKNGEYHGMVSIFKPHKTRHEEYSHGQKIADHTHSIRNKLIKLGIVATVCSAGALILPKCNPIKDLYDNLDNVRMHE